MTRSGRWSGVAALLAATSAFAQSERSAQGWSLLSGETIGDGQTSLSAQAGYPGLSLEVLHGTHSRIDVGGAVALNYSLEGSTDTFPPGFKLQGVLRACLVEGHGFNLGLRFSPGPFFYFFNNGQYGTTPLPGSYTLAGFSLPLELVAGIPIGSAMVLNAGIEVPFFFYFGPGAGAVIPILAGGGLEYFVSQQFVVSFSTHMGPTIAPNNYAYPSVEILIGAGYRL